MYHSITFGRYNTWTDWHLIPKSRPHVAPPTQKTNYVEIPGGNGSLDLSTALSGEPIFQDRTGNWDFYVDPDFKPWQELYSEIMNALHGRKVPVVLEDDMLYYWQGRIQVASWQTEQYRSVISFSYTLHPYKYLVNGSMRQWLWDTFDLEKGIIKSYDDIEVDGSLDLEVIGRPTESLPVITSSVAGMTVAKDGVTVTLAQGENYVTEFTLQNGLNNLTFTGTGVVSVDFDGRSL